MIKYKMYIKNSNKYLHDLIWLSCKNFILIASFCFLLSVYFLLVGFLDDKEALIYGICLIMIDVIMALFIIRAVLYLKKNLFYMFKFANKNGEIEYNLYEENFQYIIENLNRKTITRINFDNIKLVVKKTNVILIKMKVGNAIFLPNTEEIASLFSLNFNLNK